MSQVCPGVSGKAPWASGGVVWVAAVVCSEVLLPEPLRHESVRSRTAVTQTDTCTKDQLPTISAGMQINLFFFSFVKTKATLSDVCFLHF